MSEKYGKLIVLNVFKKGKRKIAECLCDCGNIKPYRFDLLKEGRRKSCGCIRSPNDIDYLINLQKRLLKNSVRQEECLIWQGRVNPNGYGFLSVRREGKKIGTNAHRAAYMAWIGHVDKHLFVLHKCDNRKCINPDHLFLGTHLENMMDMVSKGRQYRPIGEIHVNSKFTDNQILSIREEYTKKNISQTSLAKKYECSVAAIHNIITRKTWKHI